MNEDPAVIKKGELITCENCYDVIAEVTRDLYVNEPVTAEMFRFNSTQIKVSGDEPSCSKCQALWFKLGRLHTENGWR